MMANVGKNYTFAESKAIVRYMIDKKVHNRIKSEKLYKEMEQNLPLQRILGQRSWKGMKNHFLRKILPNIQKFCDNAQAQLFMRYHHVTNARGRNLENSNVEEDMDENPQSALQRRIDEWQQQVPASHPNNIGQVPPEQGRRLVPQASQGSQPPTAVQRDRQILPGAEGRRAASEMTGRELDQLRAGSSQTMTHQRPGHSQRVPQQRPGLSHAGHNTGQQHAQAGTSQRPGPSGRQAGRQAQADTSQQSVHPKTRQATQRTQTLRQNEVLLEMDLQDEEEDEEEWQETRPPTQPAGRNSKDNPDNFSPDEDRTLVRLLAQKLENPRALEDDDFWKLLDSNSVLRGRHWKLLQSRYLELKKLQDIGYLRLADYHRQKLGLGMVRRTVSTQPVRVAGRGPSSDPDLALQEVLHQVHPSPARPRQPPARPRVPVPRTVVAPQYLGSEPISEPTYLSQNLLARAASPVSPRAQQSAQRVPVPSRRLHFLTHSDEESDESEIIPVMQSTQKQGPTSSQISSPASQSPERPAPQEMPAPQVAQQHSPQRYQPSIFSEMTQDSDMLGSAIVARAAQQQFRSQKSDNRQRVNFAVSNSQTEAGPNSQTLQGPRKRVRRAPSFMSDFSHITDYHELYNPEDLRRKNAENTQNDYDAASIYTSDSEETQDDEIPPRHVQSRAPADWEDRGDNLSQAETEIFSPPEDTQFDWQADERATSEFSDDARPIRNTRSMANSEKLTRQQNNQVSINPENVEFRNTQRLHHVTTDNGIIRQTEVLVTRTVSIASKDLQDREEPRRIPESPDITEDEDSTDFSEGEENDATVIRNPVSADPGPSTSHDNNYPKISSATPSMDSKENQPPSSSSTLTRSRKMEEALKSGFPCSFLMPGSDQPIPGTFVPSQPTILPTIQAAPSSNLPAIQGPPARKVRGKTRAPNNEIQVNSSGGLSLSIQQLAKLMQEVTKTNSKTKRKKKRDLRKAESPSLHKVRKPTHKQKKRVTSRATSVWEVTDLEGEVTDDSCTQASTLSSQEHTFSSDDSDGRRRSQRIRNVEKRVPDMLRLTKMGTTLL